MLDRLFLAHPRTVQESYGEHLVVASSFGLTMIAAGMACMAHALVPGLFERTGSRAIRSCPSTWCNFRCATGPHRSGGLGCNL